MRFRRVLSSIQPPTADLLGCFNDRPCSSVFTRRSQVTVVKGWDYEQGPRALLNRELLVLFDTRGIPTPVPTRIYNDQFRSITHSIIVLKDKVPAQPGGIGQTPCSKHPPLRLTGQHHPLISTAFGKFAGRCQIPYT